MSGAFQLDLFDHKPLLNKMHGEELPDSVRQGQRLTGMSANQASLPLAGSAFKFSKHGQSGMEISEILPYTSKIADDLCLIRSPHTEAINHDPAITFFQTGSQIAGRPSMGSWLSYGWVRRTPTARVLRFDHQGQGRPAALFQALGQWVSAFRASRSPLSCRERSGALPGQSQRHQPEPASSHARHLEGVESVADVARTRSRNRHPHRPV